MDFPKGFPKEGTCKLQGKEYITHTGLVWLATQRGPWSSGIDFHETHMADDGLPLYVEVHTTVTQGDVSHTAIGDASRANVGRNIQTALPRMAQTRSMNRALRALLGYGATTAEEIPPDDSPPKASPKPRKGKREEPRVAQVQSEPHWQDGYPDPERNECPICQDGTEVWDNRSTATGKQPMWSCKKKAACKGARGGLGWGSWEADFFEVRRQNRAMDEAQASDNDDPPQAQDEAPLPF